VTSAPAGIACPGDCDENYGLGSNVDLTAHETPTDEFAGWRSCDLVDATDQRICHMSMTAAKRPTAVFRDISVTLTVTTAGTTASGLVSSDIGGIVCTPACSDSYAVGTSVTLTALASTLDDSTTVTFRDWGLTCSIDPDVPNTSNVCVVAMDASKTVTAFFTDPRF
jgi:hypothetical protein